MTRSCAAETLCRQQAEIKGKRSACCGKGLSAQVHSSDNLFSELSASADRGAADNTIPSSGDSTIDSTA